MEGKNIQIHFILIKRKGVEVVGKLKYVCAHWIIVWDKQVNWYSTRGINKVCTSSLKTYFLILIELFYINAGHLQHREKNIRQTGGERAWGKIWNKQETDKKQLYDKHKTITRKSYRKIKRQLHDKIKMRENQDKLEENERHKWDNRKINKYKTNKKQTQDKLETIFKK